MLDVIHKNWNETSSSDTTQKKWSQGNVEKYEGHGVENCLATSSPRSPASSYEIEQVFSREDRCGGPHFCQIEKIRQL